MSSPKLDGGAAPRAPLSDRVSLKSRAEIASRTSPIPARNAENASPVGRPRELPTDNRADDRRQAARHGQPRVEADQGRALVHVPSGRLSDDNAYPTREPLDKASTDRISTVGATAHSTDAPI